MLMPATKSRRPAIMRTGSDSMRMRRSWSRPLRIPATTAPTEATTATTATVGVTTSRLTR